MNFNYSYRAFLIACFLIGNIILAFNLIVISTGPIPQEEAYSVEYSEEDLFPEDEVSVDPNTEPVAIETHRAFNEAEKFISELERESSSDAEATETKLMAMNEAITGSKFSPTLSKNTTEANTYDDRDLVSEEKKSKVGTSNNRKSTTSYRLVDRTALHFPNPIYTCEGAGKVVIGIEVNALGKVVKAFYNVGSSTTQNECLIESALQYAKKARFNTSAKKTSQLGSITYHFPGQG